MYYNHDPPAILVLGLFHAWGCGFHWGIRSASFTKTGGVMAVIKYLLPSSYSKNRELADIWRLQLVIRSSRAFYCKPQFIDMMI